MKQPSFGPELAPDTYVRDDRHRCHICDANRGRNDEPSPLFMPRYTVAEFTREGYAKTYSDTVFEEQVWCEYCGWHE